MSRAEYSFAQLPLAEFIARFRDAPRFIGYCRECERWNRCWCCPPLTVEPAEYMRPYAFVTVAAAKIFFDDADRSRATTPELMRTVAWEALLREKTRLFDALLCCEKSSGGVQLGSGGCHLCSRCARISGEPCRRPEKLRYSLDSFGFDLTRISEELLGIRLLWSDGTELPEYYTLVHALLNRRPALDAVKQTVRAV
ncbi:MAG: hypothetical protein IJ233_12465 [Pyramidobacter sp.]|nr:hypothetical protein [Pyramidobacter sp.]